MLVDSTEETAAQVGGALPLPVFEQFAGVLAGYRYVKVVLVRETGTIHVLNSAVYAFHVNYVGERLLDLSIAQIDERLDSLNAELYTAPERRFAAGVLALHPNQDGDGPIWSLETTEVDNAGAELLVEFYRAVRAILDPAIPLYLKPANHGQEKAVAELSAGVLPQIAAHELYSTADYVPLNPGQAQGRLRVFEDEDAFRQAAVEWFDIVLMPRVPDDVPRVRGLLSTEHTTPLSHTNVLASGWGIPNAVQLGADQQTGVRELDGCWVEYEVLLDASGVRLSATTAPAERPQQPAWMATRIRLDAPRLERVEPRPLSALRAADRVRFGVKAANLGELHRVLAGASARLAGFYQVPRPPRANLLGYLAARLKVAESEIPAAVGEFLRCRCQLPRGIAVPFWVQQEFLASSPAIQQTIGKLKMALELDAPQTDSVCLELQRLIRNTDIPVELLDLVDAAIAAELPGVATFVVRSSSNAEDLAGFSAAGIYESVNHVTSASDIVVSVREVWASLVSPRSVRLRQQSGISLDLAYMGVIIQEQVEAEVGGVLVTTNPLDQDDFRSVYLNASRNSAADVVSGGSRPLQYLFNTVEGGGRTLSLGDQEEDLTPAQLERLADLALIGRLLQAHFAPDYTYSSPVDIEWVLCHDTLTLLQLRPYTV